VQAAGEGGRMNFLVIFRDGFYLAPPGHLTVPDRIVRARSGAWLDGYHNGREARRRHHTEST
jgi:hypothetical protein